MYNKKINKDVNKMNAIRNREEKKNGFRAIYGQIL